MFPGGRMVRVIQSVFGGFVAIERHRLNRFPFGTRLLQGRLGGVFIRCAGWPAVSIKKGRIYSGWRGRFVCRGVMGCHLYLHGTSIGERPLA